MFRRREDRDFELIWAIINNGPRSTRESSLRIAGQNRICHVRSCAAKSRRVLFSGYEDVGLLRVTQLGPNGT